MAMLIHAPREDVEEEYAQYGFEEEHRRIRDTRTSYIDYFTFYLFSFYFLCFSHHYDVEEECRDIVCHVIM